MSHFECLKKQLTTRWARRAEMLIQFIFSADILWVTGHNIYVNNVLFGRVVQIFLFFNNHLLCFHDVPLRSPEERQGNCKTPVIPLRWRRSPLRPLRQAWTTLKPTAGGCDWGFTYYLIHLSFLLLRIHFWWPQLDLEMIKAKRNHWDDCDGFCGRKM